MNPNKPHAVGDYTDRSKPRAERLARMEGQCTFRDPREARGGGWLDITDLDVMAALAMSRQLVIGDNGKPTPDPKDVGPEILETYYGSTQMHRQRIAKSCLFDCGDRNGTTEHDRAVDRVTALIAAQRLAGVQISRSHWAELAWMVGVSSARFSAQVNSCLAWMMGEHDRAKIAFDNCFRMISEQRANTRTAKRDERRERRTTGAIGV
jgi:hypothetical protein